MGFSNNAHIQLLIKEAKKELEGIPRKMLSAVRMAAIEEQGSHAYVNRTGTLERNTKGNLVRANQSFVRVELTMATDYASYVYQKGLSNIEREARLAEADINAYLEHLSQRLI